MKKKLIQKILINGIFYDSLCDRENVDLKCHVCHDYDIICGFGYDKYNICVECAQKYKYLNKKKHVTQPENNITELQICNDLIILPTNISSDETANILTNIF